MSRTLRSHPPDFKLAAIERMAKAPNIAALARELGVQREHLYQWQAKYRSEGMAGLRSRGRPGAADEPIERPAESAPEARIAALERKIGQQQLELDFFRAALQRVRAVRRSPGDPGETASTR